MLGSSINRLLSVGMIAAIMLVGVALLFVISDLGEGTESDEYAAFMARGSESAASFLARNEPEEAVEVYNRMLTMARDDATRHGLTIRKANALFATGSLADARTAIVSLGELLSSDLTDPMFQGWAMTDLLQFYYVSQHSDILSEIRALPRFADLRQLDDQAFLYAVAERSDLLYPTVFGKIFLAVPLARALEYGEVGRFDAPTPYPEYIETLVAASRELEETETWFNDEYSRMLAAHYRGIVLAAAAKETRNSGPAREAFEQALRIAADNPNTVSIRALSAFTHFYYAAHLLEHDAGRGEAAIDEQLALLAQKAPAVSSFGSFVLAAHENPDSSNYRVIASFAARSDAFREFLRTNYSLSF